MSNLQIIEELCGIVALQSRIITAQSAALHQMDAEIMADEIAEAKARATALCGDDG